MATQTKIPPLTVSNPWWGHDPSDKQLKALWAYQECPDLSYGGAPRVYPESTEGGRRVSVLKRQEGAPVNLG